MEHIVRVLTAGAAWAGTCRTCGWQGPWTTRIEATQEATRHADAMARTTSREAPR